MADGFVQITPDANGKRIDNAVFRRGNADIYRQRVEAYPGDQAMLDASARQRVSQLTTLFDGKTLRVEDAFLWDTKGTGTAAFVDGAINSLSVTVGQYLVRQSKTFMPYFSGKSQIVEITFDHFAPEAGVTKRTGYFSSNAVAPYDQDYDGWYVESSDTLYLVVVNNGSEKLRLPFSQWSGYADLSDYNWDNFTVILADFLWLGGAVLRLFVKNPSGGFTLAHQYDYAGSAAGVFMRSPNQPVRYEIRSTTGSGGFRSICSQVATEGALSNQAKSLVLWHTTAIATNTVGTIYAIKAVRKSASFRDIPVEVSQFGGSMTSKDDAGVWMLCLNPTLSAPLTYAANSAVEEATGTGAETLTAMGRVLGIVHVNTAGVSMPFVDNQLAWLGLSLDNSADEYVLAYMPLSAIQSVNGAISIQEF